MPKHLQIQWGKWLYTMVHTVIGGAANSAVAMFVDPAAFNFGDLKKLGTLFAAGAVISMVMFLKQSPLPPAEEVEDTKP